MIHLKKLIMSLALLLTAATGAWADESETITTATKGTTVYTGTHFKITASYICDAKGIYLFSNNNHGTATIESLNGENITKIEMHMTCGGGKATKTTTTAGQLVATNSIDIENDISVINVNATSVEIGTTVEASDGTEVQIDKYVIYYGAAASSGTPFPLTWDPETPNTAIIEAMPAGNVIVNVEYYDYATLADNSVTAATDAAANTDAKLLTVADGATTEGTLMYAIGESNTTAPTTGWSDKVPTADGLHNDTNTNVYVWYYIKGDDTHSDTEPKCITVTVLPEPTYTVSLNKTDMAEGEPAKWSAKSTNVTTAVNLGEADLEGVKKTETVTVTYSGSKKVLGVKAEKKADNAYLKWDANQKELVATEFPATANKVQNSNENVEWAGIYVVEEDVTINGEIKLTGDVELIIKDGAKLTVNKIIHTQSGASLSVYGQTQMSGELNVTNQGTDAIFALYSLAVHSCKVKATSPAGDGGGVYNTTTLNVYGGSLDAEYTGEGSGHGIILKKGGALNIYGGEVKAVGKGNHADYSYGIKSSSSSEVANVKVYGGKLWAECADNKAFRQINLTTETGFDGKIETSDNGSSWTEYTQADTPETKYVRVGY